MTPTLYSYPQITDRPASLLACAVRLLLLPAVIVLLAGTVACSDQPAAQAPPADPGQPVRVAAVSDSRPPVRLRLPGVTRAVERTDLAFLHSG